MKFSFGVLVNDLMRLDMCLRQSQLDPTIPCHTIKMPDSATKGLNRLLGVIEKDGADVAILTHQDMFYRKGWLKKAEMELAKLPDSWIVAGIVGKCREGLICGKFHDMRVPLVFNTESLHTFPQEASCFDECCIFVNMKKGFRFNERLSGFDLYGTLCVLQAWEMGGTAWIIDAFAEHYCMRPFTWYPDKQFEASFKWLHERFTEAHRIDTTVLGVPMKGKDPIGEMHDADTGDELAAQIEAHEEALIRENVGA